MKRTPGFALFLALAACAAGSDEMDPKIESALAEVRALQYQPTCELEARPEGEPYWQVYVQSDGSERLILSGPRLYLSTDWPADFVPDGQNSVRCRTAYVSNEVARILEAHGIAWEKIEVQAVQTAGLPAGQVRVWGRQEKTPAGSDFIEGS